MLEWIHHVSGHEVVNVRRGMTLTGAVTQYSCVVIQHVSKLELATGCPF